MKERGRGASKAKKRCEIPSNAGTSHGSRLLFVAGGSCRLLRRRLHVRPPLHRCRLARRCRLLACSRPHQRWLSCASNARSRLDSLLHTDCCWRCDHRHAWWHGKDELVFHALALHAQWETSRQSPKVREMKKRRKWRDETEESRRRRNHAVRRVAEVVVTVTEPC